jgi:hypothetical protein
MRRRGRGRANRCGKITGLLTDACRCPYRVPRAWDLSVWTDVARDNEAHVFRSPMCPTRKLPEMSCTASAITESWRRQRSKHGFDRHAETQQLIVLAGQAVELQPCRQAFGGKSRRSTQSRRAERGG